MRAPAYVLLAERRAPRLFEALALSCGDGTHAKLLAQLARTDLLVVDDWMLVGLPSARDFLEVIDDRCVATLRPRPTCAGSGGRHAAGLGGRDRRNTHQ